jgi:hypothetical protein
MPRYFYLLVFIILLFGGIFVALQSQEKNTDDQTTTTNSQPTLSLNPNKITPDKNGTVQLHILLNAQTTAVNSIQVTLYYDPQSLEFRDIQPEGSFATAQIVKKNIDANGYRCCHKTGSIQYTLKLNSQQKTQGKEAIVSLNFHALRSTGQTGVHFIDAQVNSQAIAKNLLLNSQDNTTITFRKPTQ